jgi:hypothetical protein
MKVRSIMRIWLVAAIPGMIILGSCVGGSTDNGTNGGNVHITRVSVGSTGVQADDHSTAPAISNDGEVASFESQAANLVTGTTDHEVDAFIRNIPLGTTLRVSEASNGDKADERVYSTSISGNGRYIVFHSSAGNLAGTASFQYADVFRHDWQSGTTEHVSISESGAAGNQNSMNPSVSSSGRYVAFESIATNLLTTVDDNGVSDIFVKDMSDGTVTRVSVRPGGAQSNYASYNPSISDDGMLIAFESVATNLIAGGTSGARHIYVHDMQTGTTDLLSETQAGVEGNLSSWNPSISADGRAVVFESIATNLVDDDTNGKQDIYWRDTLSGTRILVSTSTYGDQDPYEDCYRPSISGDARYVVYHSAATSFEGGDSNNTNDVFLSDIQTGITVRVSSTSGGSAGNNESKNADISADGNYIVFQSYASDLVSGDTNAKTDIFVADNPLK